MIGSGLEVPIALAIERWLERGHCREAKKLGDDCGWVMRFGWRWRVVWYILTVLAAAFVVGLTWVCSNPLGPRDWQDWFLLLVGTPFFGTFVLGSAYAAWQVHFTSVTLSHDGITMHGLLGQQSLSWFELAAVESRSDVLFFGCRRFVLRDRFGGSISVSERMNGIGTLAECLQRLHWDKRVNRAANSMASMRLSNGNHCA